jgi:hypothetical protein
MSEPLKPDMIMLPNGFLKALPKNVRLPVTESACLLMAAMLYRWERWRRGVNCSRNPMTPTTPVLEYLADRGRNYNMAVIQPED